MVATNKTLTSGRHVALLRGINLGTRRLPMKDLAAMFTAAGCRNVRTYIQSGNVVFLATPAVAKRVPEAVAAAIKRRFGFDAPVILRSAEELGAIVRNNPFLRAGCEPSTLHVAFLADVPARSAVAALDPDRSPPDEFIVRGGEIYLRMPNGMARTKLTNQYFDSKLATVSSARNWNTVVTLFEMTRE
jgi:uncharacterized protein (DUF1697 family)